MVKVQSTPPPSSNKVKEEQDGQEDKRAVWRPDLKIITLSHSSVVRQPCGLAGTIILLYLQGGQEDNVGRPF